MAIERNSIVAVVDNASRVGIRKLQNTTDQLIG
jgi:hypothetical protein